MSTPGPNKKVKRVIKPASFHVSYFSPTLEDTCVEYLYDKISSYISEEVVDNALIIAMGTHQRLGSASGLRWLTSDIMHIIFNVAGFIKTTTEIVRSSQPECYFPPYTVVAYTTEGTRVVKRVQFVKA